MPFRPRKHARWVLAALLVAFSGALVYYIVRHKPRGAVAEIIPGGASVGQVPASWEGIDVVRTEGDRKLFQVKAQKHFLDDDGLYQLKGGVEIRIFGKEGAQDSAHITSEGGHYDKEFAFLFLEGAVKVRLSSGLKLFTESLRYVKEKDMIRSSEAVRFERGDIEGRGTGFTFEVGEKKVQFLHKVEFDVKNLRADLPAVTHITSKYMEYNDRTHSGVFQEGVEVTNADSFLRAEEVLFTLTEDGEQLEDLDARIGVEVLFTGASKGRGKIRSEDDRSLSSIASGPGDKSLKADSAHLSYAPDTGRLAEADAVGNASVEIVRQKDDVLLSKRRIDGQHIKFVFFKEKEGIERCDADGAVSVEIFEAGKSKQERVDKHVFCQTLVAHFDPLTEDASSMQFGGKVQFHERDSRAFGEKGTYDGAQKQLVITDGNPRVEREGSTVTAQRIEIGEDTGFLRAIGEAKTAYSKRSGEISFFGNAEEPMYLSAQTMTYDPDKGLATYAKDARAWQGDNIITGDQIVVDQAQNTFTATTGVKSVLFSSVPQKGQAGPAAGSGGKERVPIIVTSEKLLYAEATRTIKYTTSVVMHREEADMSSETCEVFFYKKVNDVEKMISTGNVVINQTGRRITGQNATYDLSDDAVTLTGKPRVVDQVRGTSQGRTLTYYFGDGKIILDGQTEGRTTTVYQPEVDKD